MSPFVGRERCYLGGGRRFLKLAKFGTTKTTTTIVETTTLFFDMWVRHHDMFKVIVSDQDAELVSKFCTFLMKKAGTKLKFNMIFHLQIDGQIERVNGILNQYFKNYVVANHKD